MVQNSSRPLSRRKALAATGSAAMTALVAGCMGSEGSTSPSGSSNGGSTSGGGSSKPSYKATVPEANLEMGTMPHMTAVRELLPQATNQRMTGEIRQFENVRLILTALNSGSTDVYTNAPANLFFAQAAGNDYKLIGTKMAGTDYYIVGHKEKAPTLKSFIERSDKLTFAINQKGNIDHLQVVGVYDKEGMDFNKATTVNVGGSSARIKSFLAGRTQGFTCHIGQFERLKSEGEPVKLLAKVSEYYPSFIQECIAVPTKKLEDPTYEAWTQAYINALYKANKKATNDFEWIFKKTQKYQAQPLDRKEAKATWDTLVGQMNAWPYESFDKKPYVAVKDMLTSSNQLKTKMSVDSMVEPKYAQNAIDNL